MKLENRCDSPEVLADLPFMYLKNKDGSMRKLTVDHTAVQKSMVIAACREIGTIEEAAALRWTVLYADRDDVPLEEGAHFIADLLGLPVIDIIRDVTLNNLFNEYNSIGVAHLILNEVQAGTNNFVSKYASLKDVANQRLLELIESYKK